MGVKGCQRVSEVFGVLSGVKDFQTFRLQIGERKTSPQAKRHKSSLLFTSLTILTFILS